MTGSIRELTLISLGFALILPCFVALPSEIEEHFDADPNWDGRNNLPPEGAGVEKTQDFGYSLTNLAGDAPGEIGGTLYRSVQPSYYALPIPARTLNDRLNAKGRFAVVNS